MKIKNIIEIENNRNNDEFFKINLFKEGNWWSGYELSALLAHINNNNVTPLKVTKKFNKSLNLYFIKIGLKETSFEKYFPKYKENIVYINDEHITINLKNTINIDINQNNFQTLLNNFKEKIEQDYDDNHKPIIDNINDTNQYSNNKKEISLLTLLKNVLLYDTNNKTNEENIIFINEIKEYIIKTLFKMF